MAVQPKFKKDEWCFCEFVLQQIKETEEDRITSVTDGSFCMSGYNLSDRCYPLELRVKQISDTVKYYSKEFHALKNNALNHPDLNRKLIQMWVDACEVRHDDKLLKEEYDKIEKFCRSVIEKVRDLKYETVDDIPLFRR